MYQCDWWKIYKTDDIVKQRMRKSFPYNLPLKEERLSENMKSGNLFDYFQCDVEIPENLREAFANFLPIFRNLNVGRDIIGPFMKEYAEKEGLWTRTRRMLISS